MAHVEDGEEVVHDIRTVERELPDSVQRDYVHFKQRFTWDCGIACVIMLISRSQRRYFLDNYNEICKEEAFGESTWTIDLCYLLQRFGVRHKYLTTMLGINPAFQANEYYATAYGHDYERVMRKFANAFKDGIRVQLKSVQTDVILNHLAHSGSAIVLTNGTMLQCKSCESVYQNRSSGEERDNQDSAAQSCPKPPDTKEITYTGHYVLLCGYDKKSHTIFYRNPTVNELHVCSMSFNALVTARTATGTDEDLILIEDQ